MSVQGSKKEYDPWQPSIFSLKATAEKNQKIVDELMKLYNHYKQPKNSGIYPNAFMFDCNRIIKKATGQDIKDL